MNAAGLPVRFSTSRNISSCPAEKLLQLLIELISSPSAWYSSMYLQIMSMRCGKLRLV